MCAQTLEIDITYFLPRQALSCGCGELENMEFVGYAGEAVSAFLHVEALSRIPCWWCRDHKLDWQDSRDGRCFPPRLLQPM